MYRCPCRIVMADGRIQKGSLCSLPESPADIVAGDGMRRALIPLLQGRFLFEEALENIWLEKS